MTVSRKKRYKNRIKAMISLQLYKFSILFLINSILHHRSIVPKKLVFNLSSLQSTYSTVGGEAMETRKSSSPDTVLSPEEVKEFSDAKDKLFITLYRRRATYFNRWVEVTDKYFTVLEEGNLRSVDKQTRFIDEVIEKYAKRTEHRREKFKAKFRHAVSDDGRTIPFLDDLDVLIWPQNRAHREILIEKENEYHRLNQVINPDTIIPQEKSAPEQGTTPGSATAQAEDSSEDWKSEAGEADAESYVPFLHICILSCYSF
jgi:hypothetical protein